MKSRSETDVRDFIADFFKNKHNKENMLLTDDSDFFSSGLLSSLDFIELISCIEKHFEIELDFDNTDVSDYSTISGIIKQISQQSEMVEEI